MANCTIDRHANKNDLAIFTTFLKSTLVVTFVKMGSLIRQKYYNYQNVHKIVNKNSYHTQERNMQFNISKR